MNPRGKGKKEGKKEKNKHPVVAQCLFLPC